MVSYFQISVLEHGPLLLISTVTLKDKHVLNLTDCILSFFYRVGALNITDKMSQAPHAG